MSNNPESSSPPANPRQWLEKAEGGLDALFQRLISKTHIKHAVVAVESGDRAFRWMRAAGEASPDGAPMQTDTPFWIASITKLFIAASMLKLYERGHVALDEPISTYLPASLIDGIHRLDGTDYAQQITVRHLLGHSSGLPEYLEERPDGEPSLFEQVIEQDRAWTIDDTMALVRRLTPYFPPQPLTADRQRIRYSDTNYQLLIAIIEAVTGTAIDKAFEDLLYTPLGLKNTFHAGTPRQPASGVATIWVEDQPLHIPRAMRSFGDLGSTADDLLRFMRGLIGGEVFENPEILDLMTEQWNRFGFSLNLRPVSPNWPIEYGLAMMRFRIPRAFAPLRPVPAVIGHTGATGSWLFYCPELDVYLTGTVDQVTAAGVPFQFIPKLLRVLEKSAE